MLFLIKILLFKSIELFQPILIRKMLKLKVVNSIRDAKRITKKQINIVDELLTKILEKVWI